MMNIIIPLSNDEVTLFHTKLQKLRQMNVFCIEILLKTTIVK